MERVQKEIIYFNLRDISCRYTFTNTELTDKHSRDQYVNLLLETANDKRNGVILLEMNVRTKFV